MDNFYPHDSNARNDEKLLRLRMRHKAAGYGVYFMLLEILREKKDFMCPKDYNVIAFELREDAALVKSVVEDFGLFVFTDDGKYFYSEPFIRRMGKIGQVSKSRSDAARKRWGNRDPEQQEQYFEQLKKSEVWLIDMTIKHKCTREEILKRLDEYAIECRCQCRNHGSRQDAGRHFNAWMMQRRKARQAAAKARAAAQAALTTDRLELLKVYDQWAEAMCMKYHITHEQLCEHADAFVVDMKCGEREISDINNIRQYFNGWLRSRLIDNNNGTTDKTKQPAAAGRAERAEAIARTMATLGAQKDQVTKLPY